MATVRCANCGAENRDSSRFCTTCGAVLAPAAQPGSSPEPLSASPMAPSAGSPPPPATSWQAPGPAASPSPAAAPQIGEVIRGLVAPLEPLGKQIPTWVGALFILIGAFLPIEVSALGSASLWDFAKATMLTLVGVAIVAAALAATRRYAGLRTAGIVAFILVGTDFFDLLTAGAGINPSWAFLLLWPGTLLIILASFIPDNGRGFTFSSMTQYNPPPGPAR